MRSSLLAGVIYFAIVFAAGFVLGTVRTLALEARLTEFTAVLVEMPVILTICWLACGWVIGRCRVPPRLGPRLLMGGVAFALLMLAEVALATLLLEQTLAKYVASFATPPRALGLAGQLLFGLMPALVRMRAAKHT